MAKKPLQSPTEVSPLEARVDAMMDPKTPTEPPIIGADIEPAPANGSLPPLDIFQSITSAPALPGGRPPAAAKTPQLISLPAEVETEVTGNDELLPNPLTDFEDDATVAAVDDITAHEADTVLAAEDAAAAEAAATISPVEAHHKPLRTLFWSLIAIITVLAILMATLLTSGGNLHLPGINRFPTLWHSWQAKL